MKRIETGVYEGMLMNGKVYRIIHDRTSGNWFFTYVGSSVRITAKCKKDLVQYAIELDNEFETKMLAARGINHVK